MISCMALVRFFKSLNNSIRSALIPVGLVVAIAAVIISCSVGSIAYAAPLNFNTAESISLTSPTTTLTIATGSVADLLQVNATSVMVTLSSSTGGVFTLLSPLYDLAVASSSGGGAVSSSCISGMTSTTISQATGSAVYTIMPNGNVCANGGPLTIDSFTANPASITVGQSSVLSWVVSAASSTSIDNGVGNVTNETSTSVSPLTTTIYTLSAINGVGSSTIATTTVSVTATTTPAVVINSSGAYYGPPLPAGAPSTSIVSFAQGSSTATDTASLQTQLQSLVAILEQLEAKAKNEGLVISGASDSLAPFTRNLRSGLSGPDVKELQKFLAEDHALYPAGEVTGYFGTLTEQAVERFQKKYDIAAQTNPGYGLVGPLTREKLNDLIQEGVSP